MILLLLTLSCVTPPVEDPETRALSYLFSEDGLARARGVEEVEVRQVVGEAWGRSHVKVRQTVGGVPVFESEAILHLGPQGELQQVTDSFLQDVRVETDPLWTASEALSLAEVAWFGSEGWTTDPGQAALRILRHDGQDHLAWQVDLRHLDDTPSLPRVFIDARDGTFVWGYENLQSETCTGSTNVYGAASEACRLVGGVYFLEDEERLLATYLYGSDLPVQSDTSAFSTTDWKTVTAMEAHHGLRATWDYWETAFGRMGLDGLGGPGAISDHGLDFIAVFTSYGTNYVNAYYDSSTDYLVFGDGDGVDSGPLTVVDIVGHEATHSVTEHTADLTYSGESGGLNESMSDVFGEMIQRYAMGEPAQPWRCAEETWTPGVEGDALRFMDDPADDGISKDFWDSSAGSVDVHYSSGIGNLAFTLLSEGGSHPRLKSDVDVSAIGPELAAEIWYLALTAYMTASTNYAAARTATESAAAALLGADAPEIVQVSNAWAAVGVGSPVDDPSACHDVTVTSTLARTGSTAYQPSSVGTAVAVPTQHLVLYGPAGGDFNLVLQRRVGRGWASVATPVVVGTEKSIDFTGPPGDYRARITATTGTGTYTLQWCR